MDEAITLFSVRGRVQDGFAFATFYRVNAELGFCHVSGPGAYVAFRIEDREIIFEPSSVLVFAENVSGETVLNALRQIFPIRGFRCRAA
jgi:hypothetical protein